MATLVDRLDLAAALPRARSSAAGKSTRSTSVVTGSLLEWDGCSTVTGISSRNQLSV